MFRCWLYGLGYLALNGQSVIQITPDLIKQRPWNFPTAVLLSPRSTAVDVQKIFKHYPR